MKIAKFVLHAGRIVKRIDLDTDLLSLGMSIEALDALLELRLAPPGATYCLPAAIVPNNAGVPPFEIGLGLPPLPDAHRERAGNVSWRDVFYVRQGTHRALFQVVPRSAPERDPRIHGTVAGFAAAAAVALPKHRRSGPRTAADPAEIQGTADRIWAARPAVFSMVDSDLPAFVFADCFAAAMLQNPQP